MTLPANQASKVLPTASLAETLAELMARPFSMTQSVDSIYAETLEALKGIIEDRWGSVKKFAEAHDIDRFNLSKKFAARNLRPKYNNRPEGSEMSVGNYLKICISLNLIPDGSLEPGALDLRLSLRDYLLVSCSPLMSSVFAINFYGKTGKHPAAVPTEHEELPEPAEGAVVVLKPAPKKTKSKA